MPFSALIVDTFYSIKQTFSGNKGELDEADFYFWVNHIHILLNFVGWGILVPVGIIIARYKRNYLAHGMIQFFAYSFGVMGLASGLIIGPINFILATVQMVSPCLRLISTNHSYRFCWKVCHAGCGYTILVLGIIKGLHTIRNHLVYKIIYIVLLAIWICIAIFLEVIARRKDSSPSTKPSNGSDISQEPE